MPLQTNGTSVLAFIQYDSDFTMPNTPDDIRIVKDPADQPNGFFVVVQ